VGAQDLVRQEQGAKMQEKETLDEKLPGLFEPDTLLPIQYFEAMRRKHLLEGEKRLVLSVLEDAVECFMKCIDSSTNKGQRLFRDAEEWINLEDKKWVFSFDNVCEMLDVNPEYLRRGLREWKVRKLDAIERARVARAEQAALAASQPVIEEVAARRSRRRPSRSPPRVRAVRCARARHPTGGPGCVRRRPDASDSPLLGGSFPRRAASSLAF